MDHRHVRHRLLDHVHVADVGLDDLDLALRLSQVLALPRREVIQDAYGLTPLDERIDQVRADEACSSGNQRNGH